MKSNDYAFARFSAAIAFATVAGWIIVQAVWIPPQLFALLFFTAPCTVFVLLLGLYCYRRKSLAGEDRAWLACGLLTAAVLLASLIAMLAIDLPYIAVSGAR